MKKILLIIMGCTLLGACGDFRMRKLPRFGTFDRKDNRQLPGDRKGCPRDGDGHIRPSVV